MPATEQTWRDLKLMHVVFGLSALAMLVTTIWMLAEDHNREWRGQQNKNQKLMTWAAQAQFSEQDKPEFEEELRRLNVRLYQLELTLPSKVLIDRFKAEALYDRYVDKEPAGAAAPS